MNKLFVGFSKSFDDEFQNLQNQRFLFLHDRIPRIRGATIFDPSLHSFNPLRNIDYKRARELAAVLYTLNPQGENTLTVRNGKRALLKALLQSKRLDKLETDDEEAKALVDDLLISPVLRKALCSSHQDEFSFDDNRAVLARLNRTKLGEHDALVIGQLLINHYKGQLIVPDFGFYGRDTHISLIREERLIAGVNYLDELTIKLRNAVLLITDKRGQGALYDDAELLAKYAGHRPNPLRQDNKFNEYVDEARGTTE